MKNTRRVAIYARVSTEHEAQISALDNQIQYYDELLSKHPDWKIYDKYIDEGITGTSVHKRKNFQRMMKDAQDGCFDLIITREVSRFARNTVDTLQETRKLRKIGVEVWFIEDNIWTMNDEDGELRLTIMATLAQNESKKISQRVKAGQKISFLNAVPYGTGNILGYDRVGKEFVINQEQAETVRLIYDLYINGYGTRRIKYELERLGRKTSQGKLVWHVEVIGRILSNPFYCGIIVYRKEYVPDYLEQKRAKNKGNVEQIVVEGRHEPIISRETYARAQEIKQEHTRVCGDKLIGVQTPSSIWVKKLICACGHRYHRAKWKKNPETGEISYGYRCTYAVRHGTLETRIKKGVPIEGSCDAPMFGEWKLYLMAGMIFREVFSDREYIISIANDLLDKSITQPFDKKEKQKEICDCEKKLDELNAQVNDLLDMRLAGDINSEIFHQKMHELHEKIEVIKEHIKNLEPDQENNEDESVENRIARLKEIIKEKMEFDSYNIPDSVIDAFVDKIVVYKDRFEWHLNLRGKDDLKIDYSVTGTIKHPHIQKTVSPQHAYSSTGSNRRRQVIRHSGRYIYLATLVITQDDIRDYAMTYMNPPMIIRCEKIVVDVYI